MAAPPTAVESPLRTTEQRQSPVIVFEDVSIAFESNSVLNGISFQLNRGETKAIFGIAGAGKSTILKLAMGLVKPDSGRIYVLGEDVTTMSEEALFELRRNIGIVFQESALFDSLTVRENVAFRLMEEHDVSDEEIERRVPAGFTFFLLCDTAGRFSTQRSRGKAAAVWVGIRPNTLPADIRSRLTTYRAGAGTPFPTM